MTMSMLSSLLVPFLPSFRMEKVGICLRLKNGPYRYRWKLGQDGHFAIIQEGPWLAVACIMLYLMHYLLTMKQVRSPSHFYVFIIRRDTTSKSRAWKFPPCETWGLRSRAGGYIFPYA